MKLTKMLAGAAAIAALTGAAASAETVLKFGHVGAPGSLFEASVNQYAA